MRVVESGTLEKEIRWATKIPVLFLLSGRMLNKVLRSPRFESWIEALFQKMTHCCYSLGVKLGWVQNLNRLFKEGSRSFIIMEKPKD